MHRARQTWALPPRPPDTWLSPFVVPAFGVAVLAAIAAPVLTQGLGRTGPGGLPLALDVAACVAALVTSLSLLVGHVVRDRPALRFMAWVTLGQAGLLLAAALLQSEQPHRVLVASALALGALGAVTAPLSARRWAGLLAVVGAAAAAGGASPPDTSRASFVLIALACVGGAVQWYRTDRMTGWITVQLLAHAAAATAFALDVDPASTPWTAGTLLLTAGSMLAAAVLGTRGVTGFGRQSVRWHRLERDVATISTGSPLMPGRVIIPDDDEGLPSHAEIRALIDAAHVRIAIQPVVDLATGAVVGHEALSRFGGRVPTDRWFKGASIHSLGGELERLTVRRALHLLDVLSPEHFLAVNVSPAALNDDEVIRALDQADLSRVVVEITEHEAVADYAQIRRVLQRLRDAGARIAVDDTGAGFASLRHVLLLQPDLIKLDTSLTRGIERDPKQAALVRAFTVFAGQVGANVLAEGIEEAEQLEILKGIGVGFGQGWHLGVPAFPNNEPA